jgi:hypothetical protein
MPERSATFPDQVTFKKYQALNQKQRHNEC